MCGIVGYVGGAATVNILVEALERLEYRGYDSAGIAVLDSDGTTVTSKTVKNISTLQNGILPEQCTIGIGHTRWATHGKPSAHNAHPHSSGGISIVHNGIIENYEPLKTSLILEGYNFNSQTDSEVLAHLIHKYYSADLLQAVRTAVGYVEGTYALIVMHQDHPHELVAARKGSPLIVGLSDQGNYMASDIPAILKYTNRVIYLNDDELVKVGMEQVQLYNICNEPIPYQEHKLDFDLETADKEQYPHFLIKEIHDQVYTVHSTLLDRINTIEGKILKQKFGLTTNYIKSIHRIQILACGTSYNAGLAGKYIFESLTGIHTDIDSGSEFRYSRNTLTPDTLVIAITQSGETADTIEAVHLAKQKGCKTVAITNVQGNSLARLVDIPLYTNCGPEISVASTKTFTSSLVMQYLLSILIARVRGAMLVEEAKPYLTELLKMPGYIRSVLDNKDLISACATQFHDENHIYFVGRYIQYPLALEAALKMKEVSYIHAEGFSAGDLKHGPLALIDKGSPVFAIIPSGSTYTKMLSNIEEIRTRGGYIIAIASEEDTTIHSHVNKVIHIPHTLELLSPILVAVVVQLLAYYIALDNNCPIDQPKNIAKCVTVE